jgi:heat shock protein HslJ
VLHIHFSSDDLGRTRMACRPDFMWEIVSSLQLLQNAEDRRIFAEWRRSTKARAMHTTLVKTARARRPVSGRQLLPGLPHPDVSGQHF